MSGKFRQVRRRAGSGRFRFVSFRAEVVVVMVRGLVGCRFLGVRASDLVTAFSQSHAKPTLHHSRLSKSHRWTLNDLDRRRAGWELPGEEKEPRRVPPTLVVRHSWRGPRRSTRVSKSR